MSFDLSTILVSPCCGSPLRSPEMWDTNGERCSICGKSYHVVDGIPRFVGESEYVRNFGFEWVMHRRTQLDNAVSRQSEEDLIEKTGLTTADVKGKLVLDAGCGMGRYADVVSRWGANVVGIDLSRAVESAQKNLGDRSNVSILQADLFQLPFRKESFDVILSIGVLHHTPNCEAAFRSLIPYLKPGGKIAIWVYTHMDIWDKWAQRYRKFTVKMPYLLLYAFCFVSVPLYYLYKIPMLGQRIWVRFPLNVHPNWRWRVLDTFDWYSARYQSKHSYLEVEEWFRSEQLVEITRQSFPVGISGVKEGSAERR